MASKRLTNCVDQDHLVFRCKHKNVLPKYALAL